MDKITQWKNRTPNHVLNLKEVLNRVKSKADYAKLDAFALEATHHAYTQIDCLNCGNCCRTSVTDFDDADIGRASKFVGISRKQFIKKYLIEDGSGKYVTITSPCPFLNADNTCQIYEVRPSVCASYPHTQKKQFANRLKAHEANLDMCPITFAVVQQMEANISKLS